MRAVILEAAVSILASVAIVSATSAAPIDYTFSLAPQNNSGVAGSGTMVLNGTSLTVSLSATGLVPNAIHASHIHGLLGDPPTAERGHEP